MSNKLAEALRNCLSMDIHHRSCKPWREKAEAALAAHEAAKPEPVAWRVWRGDTYELFFNEEAAKRRCECFIRRGKPEPLYAAPVAVASPLSDERLDQIEDGCWDGPGLGAKFDKHKFARAVEAAHGIKEQA